MGIRAEIKCIIKDFASCTVGANEAINAIANVVQRPKAPKETGDPKQPNLPLGTDDTEIRVYEVRGSTIRRIV